MTSPLEMELEVRCYAKVVSPKSIYFSIFTLEGFQYQIDGKNRAKKNIATKWIFLCLIFSYDETFTRMSSKKTAIKNERPASLKDGILQMYFFMPVDYLRSFQASFSLISCQRFQPFFQFPFYFGLKRRCHAFTFESIFTIDLIYFTRVRPTARHS